MLKKSIFLTFALLLGIQLSHSQENFKLMFYNLLNFPSENAVPNRLQYLEVIMDDYRPDLFMVCELNTEDGANTILNSLQLINSNYERAVFQTNSSDDAIGDYNDLQQLLYFDSSKFSLESQDIVSSIYRDFNHYQLILNSTTQDSNPVILDVIVCHLKASSGDTNEQYRLDMIEDLETYLDTFPSDSNVVLSGDFNMYNGNEPSFQELISTSNNITFVDPANSIGNWHNNTNYIDVMTQSTRTQGGLGGSSGGFDDRFDFILTSQNMLTNPQLSFVEDSYQVYGNNGNIQCYNSSINSSNCSGSDYSFDIRNALYNFSDHLPVTIELHTNQSLSTGSFTSTTSLAIKGSNVVDGQIQFRNTNMEIVGQPITVYNSLGQQVKTIMINNTLYTNMDTSQLANGLYYCVLPHTNQQPLKFIVAH